MTKDENVPLEGNEFIELDHTSVDEIGLDDQIDDINQFAEHTTDSTELFEININSRGLLEKTKDLIQRNKVKVGAGIIVASTAVTLTTNPVSELSDKVVAAAPWVGGGIAVSEAAFVVGGAMMLSAIGSKIGNPFKIKERIPEIAEKADNSLMFKTGFWINATGAVGDFVVISAGVMKEMPISTYPLLGLTLLDLGGTVAIRKMILSGIKENTGLNYEEDTTLQIIEETE